MPAVSIIFGALLVALGVVSYTGAVPYFGEHAYVSPTALIPAAVGTLLVLCGLLALNERFLKHAMHAAAAIGLLGLIGALARIVPNLGVAIRDGPGALPNPSAFRSQVDGQLE